MARVLTLDGTFQEHWSPLEGGDPPEYVPVVWDGGHVGKRLVDAFRILRRMPVHGGPRVFGNIWPGFQVEYSDQAQYSDEAWWKAERAEERNRVKARPSSKEIAQTEFSLGWPGHFLLEFPQLLLTVGVVAVGLSMYRDFEWIAHRRLHIPVLVVRRWNDEGLNMIAVGLCRDNVRVF